MATNESQTLIGTAANDRLIGGALNDTLDGGLGSDTVNGDSGDDTLVFNISDAQASFADVYTGGSGIDTLLLKFTLSQWLTASNQAQMASYLAHLQAVTGSTTGTVSNATSSDYTFRFGTSSLRVQMTEKLRVMVDGVELDPANALVNALADASSVSEDGTVVPVHVLGNDSVDDLVLDLALVTPPAHGVASLVKPDPAVPGSWHFSYAPDNAHYQYLGRNESATDTFTYRVTDANGDTDTATVTMTITGSNDGVSITSATSAGAVVEDSIATANGTIEFTDVDLTDTHTATFTSGSATPLGTFALGEISESASTANGSLGWTYDLDHTKAQYLADGEATTETYTVSVSDGIATAQQAVTITITGTNDDVVVAAAAQAGGVTEDDATMTIDTGVISFTDADLIDIHTASFTADTVAPLGEFAIDPVSEDPTTDIGSVAWTYTIDNTKTQYLAAGETDTETYVVAVTDGTSTDTKDVTVTITGSNDEVQVTSGAQTGNVAEDGTLTATGTVSFNDVDLIDQHTASVAAAASNTTALGTLMLGAVNEAAGAANGSVGWTYNLDNAAAQSLAAGQTVIETYVITIDDGKGSTTTQEVVITITGAAEPLPLDVALVVDTDPAQNQPGDGAFAHFTATGGTGSGYSYGMTFTETTLAGASPGSDATADLTLSTAGALSASALESNRIYELSVTVSDGASTLTEAFSIITGTTSGETIGGTVANGDDVIYGLNGADLIIAGSGNDWIAGQNGTDELRGGLGNDTLIGGGNADIFVFDTALDASNNKDTITDMNAASNASADRIHLSSAIFSSLSNGALPASSFLAYSGSVPGSHSAHILFDTSTGNLYYDADAGGAGSMTLFANVTLSGTTTLDASDFVVIAPPGP